MSETSAKPTGPRLAVPPKITSSIFAPRRDREDCSPRTHRMASEIFDFPEPFRTDDRRNAAEKFDLGAIRERLEAL